MNIEHPTKLKPHTITILKCQNLTKFVRSMLFTHPLLSLACKSSMKVCRCVVSYVGWTWPWVVSQAPGQSSAGQGYNVCTFGSCFTSCLWPTLPQVLPPLTLARGRTRHRHSRTHFLLNYRSRPVQENEDRHACLSVVFCIRAAGLWRTLLNSYYCGALPDKNDMMTARHIVTVGLSFSETDTENHSFN